LVIVVVVERTTDVVVVGAVLVVVELTTAGCVVVGLVEETVEGSCTITRRVDGLDVAVSVNSRTRSSRGLDHITRWALRSEKCLRATAIRR
jgi:metal-sulfur cluster biosynthetic enzyme